MGLGQGQWVWDRDTGFEIGRVNLGGGRICRIFIITKGTTHLSCEDVPQVGLSPGYNVSQVNLVQLVNIPTRETSPKLFKLKDKHQRANLDI